MMIHLTARAHPGLKPLASPGKCFWLWPRLRELFASALAACLMPDHLHLLLAARDPSKERTRLAHLLGAMSRYQFPDAGWSVAEPTEIRDWQHLKRNVRYVHLNPCRAGLVSDPLSWLCSTHRGLIGAAVD